MNNLEILAYKNKREILFNQCFEKIETFLDEETKNIVYCGTGELITNKVVDKVNPLDEEFRLYCIDKFICKLDKENPKLSLFYKILDLKYFDNKIYPQFILYRISANFSISKNHTKKSVSDNDFYFIDKEEILQVAGWYESKKVSFDKRYLYVLKNELGRYKIGVAVDVEKRVKALSISSGSKIEIIYKFNSRGNFENKLHKHFKEKRYLGEWFCLNDEDLDFIKNINFSESWV